MKRISRLTGVILLFFLSLVLLGCDLNNQLPKTSQAFNKFIKTYDFSEVENDLDLPEKIDDVEIEYYSTNTTVLTHNGKIFRSNRTETVILYLTFLYKEDKLVESVKVTIMKIEEEPNPEPKPEPEPEPEPEPKPEPEPVFDKPFKPTDMEHLQDKLMSEDVLFGLPSEDTVKALIIPIDFVDYRFPKSDLLDLEKAFFGTEADTGWESVKTYYSKSSYGKLNFTGTITDVYSSNKTASYYTNAYNNDEDADYYLIKEALEYFDDEIDYSEYDTNNDGYIDALYFIYSTPVDYGDYAYESSDLWWAYVYQYFTDYEEYYDGVEANYYFWAGSDFMYEAFTYTDYVDYNIKINASTYIHETGHMLGLDDYYDYDDAIGPDGGLGGADMMDYTVGDHSSFSKIMLNWTTPYIADHGSMEIKIKPFESSGDVILVTNKWNNTYFDEYFLIDYYTPTGLNQGHKGFNGLFSSSGIRIYHVNSVIDYSVGSPQNVDGYFSVFSYNNSDTKNNLISFVEADENNSIRTKGITSNTDLFQAGQIFGETVHRDYRLHNNSPLNFTVKIVSITPTEATIQINFK